MLSFAISDRRPDSVKPSPRRHATFRVETLEERLVLSTTPLPLDDPTQGIGQALVEPPPNQADEISALAFAETALDRFVQAANPDYGWTLEDVDSDFGVTRYTLNLTSGSWRSPDEVNRTLWQHTLTIWVPDFRQGDTALLLIGGGSNNDDPLPSDLLDQIGRLTALTTGSVVVSLEQVPNQPLIFAGENFTRTEDAIIAYSWAKYLETGDETWPAQLPMTRAAITAMDATQEFLQQQRPSAVPNDFIVTGGSKRGWTTWLAAVAEANNGKDRVRAIIPGVIDVLNVQESFVHHYESYGFWAPAVEDYVEAGIMDNLENPMLHEMLGFVDPYAYLDRLTLPKVILNSTGDQFFVPDSWKFYYDDLMGPKWLYYAPNTDHGLNEETVFNITVYFAMLRDGTMPEYTWEVTEDGKLRVQVGFAEKVAAAKLWQAHNPDARDFRRDVVGPIYQSTPLQHLGGGVYEADLLDPVKGFTAFVIEIEFANFDYLNNIKLSSGVEVVPAVDRDTIGVFNPSTSTWYLKNTIGNGAPDLGPLTWGNSWKPVVGDWKGDYVDRIAVFGPGGQWFLRDGNEALDPVNHPVFAYGNPNWIPVMGDWNGDGIDTVGVFDPSTATWYLKNTNSSGAPDITPFQYGGSGWIPVVGDWDGDGIDTIGVFDPNTATWYLRNTNSSGAPDIAPFQYGAGGWLPVVGDWDAQNGDSIGVVNNQTGTWYLRNSNTPGPADVLAPFNYGAPGWVPLAGNWNGSHSIRYELPAPGEEQNLGSGTASIIGTNSDWLTALAVQVQLDQFTAAGDSSTEPDATNERNETTEIRVDNAKPTDESNGLRRRGRLIDHLFSGRIV